MNDELDETLPTPKEVAIVSPLPYAYDPTDKRVNAILDQVAEFCGHEFTEVPPNPDEEPGGIMPLADDTNVPHKPQPGDPDFVVDPDDPDKTGQIDPDEPGLQPDEGTSDEELDQQREAYKEAKEKNEEEKKSYWAVLWQVIRLLSDSTCWTDSFDDTFIYQHRTEEHQVDQVPYCQFESSKCFCPKPLRYRLHYAPVEDCASEEELNPMEKSHRVEPFIGGEFHYMNDLDEYVVEPIPAKYLNSHYNPHREEVTIYPNDFSQALVAAKCGCPQVVDVVLHYNAGYCSIPEALLPLVCQLIHKIEDSKQSINDCAGAMTQVAGLLKSKKVGNVQYSWSDKDTEASKTQALFTQIYNLANVAELFSLSRCDIINVEEAGDVI